MGIASINGQLSNQLSVFDRGLLFGESLYEVIPLYHGKAFHQQRHLERLRSSFSQLFNFSLDHIQIEQWLNAFIKELPYREFSAIYIHCSTGSQQQIRSHLHHQKISPNVIIFEYPATLTPKKSYLSGQSAILFPDIRSHMANHKSTQLSINTMALNQAQQQGFSDAIFVRDTQLTEAASSNLFVVIDGTLVTPRLQHIVPGITRHCVLDIASQLGIPIEVRDIHTHELAQCEEIFLSSSIKRLKPITTIKDHIKLKAPGPIWETLFDQYHEQAMNHAYHCQTT